MRPDAGHRSPRIVHGQLRDPLMSLGRVVAIWLVVIALSVAAPHAGAQERPNSVLLVARPELRDPNFAETVVLVTRHRGGAAVGVVLNRPSSVRVREAFPDEKSVHESPEVVFRGGPVSPSTLVAVFRSADQPDRSLPVLADVHISLDPGVVRDAVARASGEVRVYAGYAGWAPGQLEMEIHTRGWYVLDAEVEAIFTRDPARLWRMLLLRATSRERASAD